MAYSAYAVANAFIRRAQEGRLMGLSPMKLQKLMYFAQVWHLRGTPDRRPLLDDNFARWTHGPVVPSIYHEFKAYGYQPIGRMATTLSANQNGYAMNVPTIPDEDRSAWGLIDAIIGKYGHLDATTLSSLTHLPGSAWAAGGPNGAVITAQEMINDATIN